MRKVDSLPCNHQAGSSATRHINTPHHQKCTEDQVFEVVCVNDVDPIASVIGYPLDGKDDPYNGRTIQSKTSGIGGQDICNNVGPYHEPAKQPLAHTKYARRKTECRNSHSRIPSIVIDDTHAPKPFIFAVLIGGTTPNDSNVEYQIRDGCSTLARAEKWASARTSDAVAKYAAELHDDAKNEAFHILEVGMDYPAVDIEERGDPYFPPTYTGPRPTKNTWAVCKHLHEGGIEVHVRFWKHSSHLRWIKTIRSQVQDEWTEAFYPPLRFYLVQCKHAYYHPTNNVYPGSREATLEIGGAFWSRQKASEACDEHIASLGIGDAFAVEKTNGFNLVYEAEGVRYKWCIKQYAWDGGMPGSCGAQEVRRMLVSDGLPKFVCSNRISSG